jgi:hypothetical protein
MKVVPVVVVPVAQSSSSFSSSSQKQKGYRNSQLQPPQGNVTTSLVDSNDNNDSSREDLVGGTPIVAVVAANNVKSVSGKASVKADAKASRRDIAMMNSKISRKTSKMTSGGGAENASARYRPSGGEDTGGEEVIANGITQAQSATVVAGDGTVCDVNIDNRSTVTAVPVANVVASRRRRHQTQSSERNYVPTLWDRVCYCCDDVTAGVQDCFDSAECVRICCASCCCLIGVSTL